MSTHTPQWKNSTDKPVEDTATKVGMKGVLSWAFVIAIIILLEMYWLFAEVTTMPMAVIAALAGILLHFIVMKWGVRRVHLINVLLNQLESGNDSMLKTISWQYTVIILVFGACQFLAGFIR